MPKAAARKLADWTVDKVRTPAIPYVEGRRSAAGTDCINLIGWGLEELTGVSYERGSNSAWRKDMMWRGTLKEAKALKYLMPGAIVYINDGPSAKWPDGDYGHAGVYVGFEYGLKNPEGKPADVVHASQSRGGVYGSVLDKNGWTHVAWHKGVDYSKAADDAYVAGEPEAPTSAETKWLYQATVNTDDTGLNFREKPSKDSGRVDGMKVIPKGATVKVLEETNAEWMRVEYQDYIGYAYRQFLRRIAGSTEPSVAAYIVEISSYQGGSMSNDDAAAILAMAEKMGYSGTIGEVVG